MNDCQKIESALWDYNTFPAARRAEIDQHLLICARCSQAAQTIKAIGESAVKDKETVSAIDSQAFNQEVMRKIAVERAVSVTSIREQRQNNWRMALSFAMASAVVLLLMKSVSDLDRIGPREMALHTSGEEKEYGLIHVDLAPQAMLEKKVELPVRAKNAAPGVTASRAPAEQEEVFSILPAPVTSPDSINIDAVYVSNDNIALNQQSSAASLAELYSDTAAVQSAPLQASRMVTIEQMPRPLRIAIPEYPVWAKKRGMSGTVWIKAKVESDGRVGEAQVLSCDTRGAGFEEAALKAAKDNLFVPASSNGINLAIWVVYPVKFINKN